MDKLLELTPRNVCVGYLIARYASEFHADEFAPESRLDVLMAWLLEKVLNIESPLPYKSLLEELQSVDQSWAMDLNTTMHSLVQGSIDDLEDFLATHFHLMSGLDATTPLGRFLRMMAHANAAAFFDRLCRLQQELEEYIASTLTIILRPNVENLLDELDAGRIEHSMEYVEGFLQECLMTTTQCSRLHFARFLNFKLHREYYCALQALHAYHDYALKENSDDLAFGPQYATLNLAGLYLSFDYKQEAVIALHETIRVAQNKRDGVCIAYALAWYMQLYPNEPERIHQCLERAQEHGLTALSILASLLAVTKIQPHGVTESFTQPNTRPISVWLQLKNTAHTLETAAGSLNPSQNNKQQNNASTNDTPKFETTWTKAAKDDVIKRWLQLRGAIALTSAQMWHEFGHRTLERLHTELHGLCYISSSNTTDLAIAVQRIALLKINPTRISVEKSNIYANTLRWVMSTSTTHKITHEPRYRETLLQILFEWAYAQGLWLASNKYYHLLAELTDSIDTKLLQGDQLRLWLYQQQRGCDAIRELKTLAYVKLQPDAPFDAISPLLECFKTCDANYLDTLRAQATIVQSELYLCMDRFEEAQILLEKIWPHILEHGGLHLQAEYTLTMSRVDASNSKQWLLKTLAIAEALQEKYLEREVVYLLALQDKDEDTSKRFLQIDEALQAAQTKQIVPHPLGSYSELLQLMDLIDATP
ncbi:anaphase-promoting complex subunit 5 [Thraustotheca clavata]|uniref:Anaphase-promoting complex subunit 5 n=1 Tax=Thraustotheca clavata TaxID=74557 RepID=A0A1W0A761_9STRA|nr:anaphase-promoting complex subunit 5 [Thraustotheca clavata]